MDAIEIKVHESHCCLGHGCKYANVDCPVALGRIDQMYPCERCGHWDDLKDEYGDGVPVHSDPEYIEYFESEVRPAYEKEFAWQRSLKRILARNGR